jgi:peptide/nickel transport system substrate-binding protein
MPRRRPLASTAATAATAATALLLSACGGGSSASAPAAGSPTSGGTITFATDREPTCLDPAVGGDQPQSLIARAYLDSLVSQDQDGTIKPWLATSWDISPDGLTYTFHLRDDVTFTDGTPFDAAAVKANFEHWLDPATQSSVDALYVSPYVGTQTPDPHTAVVTLSHPYAAFLEVLAQSFLGIQSPAAITRGNDQNCQTPVGSGPFKVVAWNKQQDVKLVRNDAYTWGPPQAKHQGKAYADAVDWRFISEPSTRFGALQSGEVGAIETVPPQDHQVATSTPNLKVIDGQRPGSPVQLFLNTTRAPFDDLGVRQAFRQGADVAAGLKSVFFGAYHPFGGSLSPTTTFYSSAFEHAYPYDLTAAGKLLDDAGWDQRDAAGYRTKNGRRLTVHFPVSSTDHQPADISLFEQVQATEKKLGFQVVIDKQDSATWQAGYLKWDYDVTDGYWVTNTADALRYVYLGAFKDATGGWHSNASGIADPKLDADLQQALLTTDPAQREALYDDAQKIISGAAVNVPLYVYPAQYAENTDRVQGLGVDPTLQLATLYDAWVVRRG